ncbi:MAG: rod shape-determining protein MreC [Gammaproteobacteria bacterium]|nr:rod shape-determining protein MreC [Gammaproteobacteria bacterium]
MSGDTNSLFLHGPSALVRLILLGLLSIVLMTADHRLNYLGAVRSTLALVVYPLQIVAAFPPRAWDWVGETFASRDQLLAENERLRTSHLLLEVRMQRHAALEAENQRLRELLGSTTQVSGRMLISELMSVDLDPYRHEVLVNKGSQDGVFEGQPVLDALGVMGQVVRVTPLNSTVLMITDPSHALPVQINRTGERTVAVGTGDLRLLRLPYLPNNVDLREGDLLVTSGLGDRFPAGYPVAVINAISHDPGEPFARVTALPTAHLARIREALLLWPTSRKNTAVVVPADAVAEGADQPIVADVTTAQPAQPAEPAESVTPATAPQSATTPDAAAETDGEGR